MATPAENIVALEAALAAGELRVEVNGEMVIYKSTDDHLKAIAYFKNQLAQSASAGNPAPAVTLATFGND